MILITSAAYVNQEFQIEFGRLPPAFLPVGNRRLFEHQIASLRRAFPSESLYLSLPDQFELNVFDRNNLERSRITIIRSNPALALASAVKYAIGEINPVSGPLRILHGDTLVFNFPVGHDVIGIVHTTDDYLWEVEAENTTDEAVWGGYFSFSSPAYFWALLEQSGSSFTHAIRAYDKTYPMQRMPLSDWLDLGHVNTYFQSRAQLTTERAFNSLLIQDGCVRKTGALHQKIVAESRWFENLPSSLKKFAPQLIDSGGNTAKPYYVIEYLPLPPLNEVFVHGKNPTFYWSKVLGKCLQFLRRCQDHEVPESIARAARLDFHLLAREKTEKRLQDFIASTDALTMAKPLRVNGRKVPCLKELVSDCANRLVERPGVAGVLHGDFCLSNILFDSRSDSIKVIDPRGLNGAEQITNIGDLRYDLAKLAHSVVGLYDHIIAGAYELECHHTDNFNDYRLIFHVDSRIEAVQKLFMAQGIDTSITVKDVMPMVVLLFVSMLPLHADRPDRQQALLANALRLYAEHIQ